MTGAGRLSSGPQPVMSNAAPLFLSCIVYRRRRRNPLPLHLPSGMEARRVKTRLKPGFQRQPTARSRRETANHWAADQQGLLMNLLRFSEAIRFCVPTSIRMRTSATSVVTAVAPPSRCETHVSSTSSRVRVCAS